MRRIFSEGFLCLTCEIERKGFASIKLLSCSKKAIRKIKNIQKAAREISLWWIFFLASDDKRWTAKKYKPEPEETLRIKFLN